jgi:hypothetical protein
VSIWSISKAAQLRSVSAWHPHYKSDNLGAWNPAISSRQLGIKGYKKKILQYPKQTLVRHSLLRYRLGKNHFDPAPYRQSTSSLEASSYTADMAAAKSSQAPPMPVHDDGYASERQTTSSSVPPTSALALLIAAALCNALAGRTWAAMSTSEPWWLGHAASMTIRAFGVDLVNRSEAFRRDYRGILHLGVMVLGWALDRTFVYLYA